MNLRKIYAILTAMMTGGLFITSTGEAEAAMAMN
jgi:hypothetical protein